MSSQASRHPSPCSSQKVAQDLPLFHTRALQSPQVTPAYPFQLDGVHTAVEDGAGVGAVLTDDDVVGTDVVGGATVGEKVASASVGGSVLDDAWHSHIASLVPTNT